MTTQPTDQRCCVAGANRRCKYIVNYLNVFSFVSVFKPSFSEDWNILCAPICLKRVHDDDDVKGRSLTTFTLSLASRNSENENIT